MATSGQLVGYRRVSTLEQSTARQLEGLTFAEMFEDKASGKDTNRPQLDAMLKYVRKGDTIVVHSLDRLARNLDDLRHLVTELTNRGVRVQFVKENLTFTGGDSPMATLLLNVMGTFAQFERELIKERQREGIMIAKQKGVYKGRKPSLSSEAVIEICSRIAAGEQKARLAREFGISRETLYTYLRSNQCARAA